MQNIHRFGFAGTGRADCAGPGSARAQSTISGLVTDTTGAVLPGVTVEAESPALIEKVGQLRATRKVATRSSTSVLARMP